MSNDFNIFGLVAEEILELQHKLTVNVDVLTLRKYRTLTVDQLSLRLTCKSTQIITVEPL